MTSKVILNVVSFWLPLMLHHLLCSDYINCDKCINDQEAGLHETTNCLDKS